jgi:hypothetical protein
VYFNDLYSSNNYIPYISNPITLINDTNQIIFTLWKDSGGYMGRSRCTGTHEIAGVSFSGICYETTLWPQGTTGDTITQAFPNNRDGKIIKIFKIFPGRDPNPESPLNIHFQILPVDPGQTYKVSDFLNQRVNPLL